MADTISILPSEVWQIILSNIQEDENDALSCYQTCTLWHSTLEKSRTSWLFPFLYPHLHNQLKYNLEDVMRCRSVCKLWAKGVDRLMESYHFHPMSMSPPNSHWLTTQPLWSYSPNKDRFIFLRNPHAEKKRCETFMAQFKDCENNPFISRSLTLHISYHARSQSIHFLKQFGHHIWALKLNFLPKRGRTRLDAVEYLWQLLEWLPCLKYLYIFGINPDRCLIQPNASDHDPDLHKFMETHSLPNLPHLLLVDLRGEQDRKLEKIFKQFKCISKNVTILYSYDYLIVWSLPRLRSSLTFSWNLSQLFFRWDNGAPYFQSQLEALSYIKLPLEKIEIVIQCIPNVEQLFRPILKFNETLHTLSLHFNKFHSDRWDFPAQQALQNGNWNAYSKYFSYISQLHKLKRLEIWFSMKAGCPSLEQLGILAHSVLMDNWKDYQLAGDKERKIDIETFPSLTARIKVSLLKKERELGRLDDGNYPLSQQDRIQQYETFRRRYSN